MAEKKFERSFIITSLILSAALLIYFFGIINPYISRRKEISAEIEKKSGELELFRKEKGGITSSELIESLEASQEDYRKKIAFLKEHLGKFDITLPAQVNQKGLFFKEKAYQSERRLREEAEAKKVILPVSLGFDQDVPKEKDAEILLWELAAMEKVVGALIASGMDNLVSVRLNTPKEHIEGEIPYTSFPMEIRCQGETAALLEFLHSLTQATWPLVIEKMEIQKISQKNKEILDINLTIQGIQLK